MLNDTVSILIKHIEELRKKAVKEQPLSDLKKYWSYYSGDDQKGKQYNVIKGIIDAKSTLILDNEIVSTVIPRLKTFVDTDGLALQNDIADILRDINAYVLDDNNFEKIKSEVVLNALVYNMGIVETVWEQGEDNQLGDIRINSIDPLKFYPDMSAKRIQDMNYCFIEESYSPITLKKKYPKYAEKLQASIDEGRQSESDKKPTGVTTLANDYNTTQSYSYSSQSIGSDKQKNIKVWKCYLKDDSTFVAKETDNNSDQNEAELKYLYPNGRLIVYVDGAKDYILEDKPIDYPFGVPIDIFSRNTSKFFGASEVKYLIDIQDRINKAFEKLQYLVGSDVGFIVVDGKAMIDPDDIINQAVLIVENYSDGSMGSYSNDAIEKIKFMLEYIDKLEQFAYKISRVNPMMVDGERPQGVTSGEQITKLNESPMTAIKEWQRHFKYFVCEQGQKNVVLIQLFYNTPRMIRLSNSKQVAEIPQTIDPNDPEQAGLQAQPIKIYEQQQNNDSQNTYYEAIREIQGDLSIGEYDMQVIAGTEMPRSRGERAQITMQLAQMGYLGNDKVDVAESVLTAIDYPYRHQVIDKMREQQAQMSKNPSPEPPTDKIQVNFKDLDPEAKNEWYKNNGFIETAQALSDPSRQNLELLKNTKELTE